MPKATRERASCPDCFAVNIRKSRGKYTCRNCDFKFSHPHVRQLSVKYQERIPLLLRKAIENKQPRETELTRVDIDTQEFTKLYSEGVSHRDLAKKYGCGTTKIQNLRRELDLLMRIIKKSAQAYHPKNVDEKRFRKMYESGYSYQQIGEEFGITTVRTVTKG
jgi:hypothetical protein